VSDVIPAGVGIAQPAHEFRQLSRALGPQNHVPVIWHDAKSNEAHLVLFDGKSDESAKSLVASGALKNLESTVRSVEHVIRRIGNDLAGGPWHRRAFHRMLVVKVILVTALWGGIFSDGERSRQSIKPNRLERIAEQTWRVARGPGGQQSFPVADRG